MATATPRLTATEYTAARIKKARKEHIGMTQRELARVLDVEQVSVSRWERNAAEPKPRYIRAIASLAKLPVNWFYPSESEVAA